MGPQSTFERPIARTDLELARWLKGAGYAFPMSYANKDLVLEVLSIGPCTGTPWLPVLRFLVEELGMDFGKLGDPARSAARGGSLEVMQLVLEHGGRLTPSSMVAAVEYGQLPMCRWLRQQGLDWRYDVIDMARSHGADEVAAWIEAQEGKEREAASNKASGGTGYLGPAAV